MSNDSKFWAVRLGLFAAVAIDLLLLSKLYGEVMGQGSHLALWAWVFFISTFMTLPLGYWASTMKRKRWDKADPMDRVEMQTLSNYSASDLKKTPKTDKK